MEDGVTVGEALAEARDAAGLTIDEVSKRTRIREIVIRSIERNDFNSLGGDVYVRGYLRAIAGAVGLDPQPLIREFDAARSNVPDSPSAAATPAATAVASTVEVPIPAQSSASVAESGSGAESSGEAEEVIWAEGVAGAQGHAEADDVVGAQDESGTDEVTWAEGFSQDDAAAEDVAGAQDDVAAEGAVEVQDDAAAEGVTGAQDGAKGPAAVGESGWTFWDNAVVGMQSWGNDLGEPSIETAPTLDETLPAWSDPVPIWGEPTPAWGEPATPWEEPAALWGERGPRWTEPGAAGGGGTPGPTAKPAPRSARSTRARVRATVAIFSALMVLGVVGVSSAEIISKLDSGAQHAVAASDATPTAGPTPTGAAEPTAAQAAAGSATPTPAPATVLAPPLARLAIRDAQAFGPDGVADGDNPDHATYAIAADAPEPWRTQWYATAEFGQLKHGTGLLLDMGRRVTVASVQVQLGSPGGADLQIRAGDEASLDALPVVASQADAGGLLTVSLAQPVRSRFVLLWFVKLPPTGSGTYRASVYGVVVTGRP